MRADTARRPSLGDCCNRSKSIKFSSCTTNGLACMVHASHVLLTVDSRGQMGESFTVEGGEVEVEERSQNVTISRFYMCQAPQENLAELIPPSSTGEFNERYTQTRTIMIQTRNQFSAMSSCLAKQGLLGSIVCASKRPGS